MILRHETRSADRRGFTLLEMMVVVAILVVLAGTGGVIYLRFLEDARKDTAKAQTRILAQTAAAYQVKYGEYPPSLESLTQPTADGGKPYLEASALIDPWGRAYQYAVPGSHHPATAEPDIWSQGPNVADPNGMLGNW
jgi:general secretion pathway protein G